MHGKLLFRNKIRLSVSNKIMKQICIFLFLLLLCACLPMETRKAKIVQTQPMVQTADEQIAKLNKIKDSVVPFFEPMRVQDGDWLESFQENGQNFDEYLKCNPTLPTAERKTIYIQPIGDFTEKQREILQITADYMKAFYNLPVKLNAEQKLENVPKEMERKNPAERHRQIKSGYFLDKILPEMLPPDAAAFICFTNFDLFPDENWNYVFGQANLKTRVGVWSLWRFGNAEKSADDYKLFLSRTLKVAMHETGHMFSMQHCTKYECLMSGSNHLGETDRRPLDVCPECMAKIAWAMNYEPAERYENLARFWGNQNRSLFEQKTFGAKKRAVEKISENDSQNPKSSQKL